MLIKLYFTANELHDFVLYTSDTMPSRDQPAPDADAPTSTICSRYQGAAPSGQLTSVQCDDVTTGRYVILQIPGDGCIVMCELEIYRKFRSS